MHRGTAKSYRAFVRTWWRRDPSGVLVPGAGPERTIARRLTYDEALAVARQYNATHPPGPYSRKCEFTEE